MTENKNIQPLILNRRGRRPPPLVINMDNNMDVDDDYPDPPPAPVGPRPNN